MRACLPCLRRTQLLADLAGRIEIERKGRPVGELLALSDAALLDALDGESRLARHRHEHFDGLRARARLDELGLWSTCRHFMDWPAALADGDDDPASVRCLVGAGDSHRFADLIAPGRPAVAIVGSRRATAYGLGVARALGRGLSAAGVTVVSGMALGVDAAAHLGALEAGGNTVAVLGGGPDVPYPRSKTRLHRELVERAAVVSELPPGMAPRKWTFPARNRIIADLAQLTVVVEAAERSGSLITAVRARERNREVGAVPGLVTNPVAAGAIALLKDGAHVVRDAADVLDLVLGVGHAVTPAAGPHVPARLRATVEALGAGEETVDALAAAGRPIAEVHDQLAELELLGAVQRAPGGRWLVTPG